MIHHCSRKCLAALALNTQAPAPRLAGSVERGQAATASFWHQWAGAASPCLCQACRAMLPLGTEACSPCPSGVGQALDSSCRAEVGLGHCSTTGQARVTHTHTHPPDLAQQEHSAGTGMSEYLLIKKVTIT